jgi:hypothetical protein
MNDDGRDARDLSQPLDERGAVHVRQHEIEENDVRPAAGIPRVEVERFGTGLHPVDVHAVVPEQDAHGVARVRVVLDEQQMKRSHP